VTNGANKRWWHRTEQATRALETWLIVIILGGLVLLGAGQIVLRNVFSVGLPWADGLSRLAVLWLGLLGALAASRDGRHIALGAVTRWLPERARRFAGVAADLVAAAISAVLAWYALSFVLDSREFGDVLLDDIPAWWLQAIMPAAFALMAVQFILHAVRRALGRVSSVEIGL
jgi:TRAP-type C4-dicarboxylate transport system permease small subunit